MNEKIFHAVMIYLLLATVIIGFMPSSFFNGSQPTLDDDLKSQSVDDTGSISWFGKVVRFLFVPFVIDGIPAIISLLIGIVNFMSMLIGAVYIYDKFRGIGS